MENVEVLINEQNIFKRKFKEYIKIQQSFDIFGSTCLNLQVDLENFENVYKSFI